MSPHDTILVMDDDRDILELIAAALRDEGYRLVEASSNSEALTLLARGHFGLIVGDAPGRTPADRWEGLDDLRRVAGGAPMIICLAHAMASFAGYAERGFVGLLPKPFMLDDLLAIVDAHLPQWRARSDPTIG